MGSLDYSVQMSHIVFKQLDVSKGAGYLEYILRRLDNSVQMSHFAFAGVE